MNNILLVSHNYYPFTGGVEVHVRQVAQELSRAHQVSVAAVRFSSSRLPRGLATLEDSLLLPRFEDREDGAVKVHALTVRPTDRVRLFPLVMRATPRLQRYAYHGLNRLGYRFYRRVFVPKLRRLMEGMDVVHCMAFGHLGWAAQEAAAQAGVPFVCTPFVHPRQWGDGPDDVAYYKRSKAIVALVETDRKYLASLGIDPRVIRVIGVSPELPTTTDPAGFRQRHGLGTAPVVLYVGRMMPQKGAAAVLAGAPLIWRNHPEVRFVFIGPATVPEAAQFQNVDRRISYLGRVSVQEKADALAACDVFCMPSISEILPTVYLEAWNFGKPVVGGLAHGLLELVEGANAGLVSSQEPPELAATLCRLLADADLRIKLGSNGRALVELKYSVAAVTSSLLEMYQQVANLRPTRLPE